MPSLAPAARRNASPGRPDAVERAARAQRQVRAAGVAGLGDEVAQQPGAQAAAPLLRRDEHFGETAREVVALRQRHLRRGDDVGPLRTTHARLSKPGQENRVA